MEDRENNLAMMRLTLELAKDLGISIVKVFAAWPGIINDEEEIAVYGPYERGSYYKRLYPDELRKWHRAVAGIKELADRAADMGITLALQNHTPVIRPGYEDALAMLQEIDKPNLKLCLDVPLFYERQQDDYVREAVEACGKDIVLTHCGAWNFKETADGKVIQEPAPSFGGLINYETYLPQLQQIGYKGYLVTEYCLPVIKNHKIGGVKDIDEANRITLSYMKDLVANSAILV